MVFTAGPPHPDRRDAPPLPAHRENPDRPVRLGADLVENAKILDAQLPGRDRVGPQRLAVPGLHQRLIRQLALDGIEDDRSVAGRQCSKMA
jgi:hypothetical protein